MKHFTAFFLLAAAQVAAQTGDPDRLAAALADRALADHVGTMKTDERVRMYQALVKAKPEDFHYQNLLASTYIQKMRETMDPDYLERASKLVQGALAADSSNYEALRLRSVIELERHNFKKVAEYSRMLIKIAPDDPWNWGALGDALMELGQYDPAADAYQKMVSLRPDLASYNRAAYYRFMAGDAEGALDVMKQAIGAGSASAENTAWCLVDLGNMEFKTGRLAEAARAFQTALRVFPGYHPAHAGMGRVLAAQNAPSAAIESYQRAQAIVPLVEYAAALHDLYAAAGRKDEAAKQAGLIDMIDALERTAGTANRNLAMVYADHDRRLDRALELAQAELAVRGDVYTYDALAWTLYKNKQYTEAGRALEKVLQMGTQEPAFYYHAGMIERALGKNPEARRHLERALELNARFDVRQAAEAEAALREVVQ